MSFFITSVGKGDGANYGGLAGADAYCQRSAPPPAAARRCWHAYLSTQGPGAVNARDRIGNGPWFNARGQRVAENVAELHGDTIEQARLGNALGSSCRSARSDHRQRRRRHAESARHPHRIAPDGRAFTDTADHTCSNYTSNANVEAPARGAGAPAAPPAPGPSVQLGHHDKQGGGNGSWNSTHASRGCSQPNLVATGGAGLLYCFAVGQ